MVRAIRGAWCVLSGGHTACYLGGMLRAIPSKVLVSTRPRTALVPFIQVHDDSSGYTLFIRVHGDSLASAAVLSSAQNFTARAAPFAAETHAATRSPGGVSSPPDPQTICVRPMQIQPPSRVAQRQYRCVRLHRGAACHAACRASSRPTQDLHLQRPLRPSICPTFLLESFPARLRVCLLRVDMVVFWLRFLLILLARHRRQS
ncbi:hypothetical protein PLICRDRAFT_658164 [Plicaturopsis crispa FD-325 SS-3]|nr:hypothetical protein PLICRDRAFT_658164 [Plicaturopsis crispa FD-325 SS-3]